MPIQKTPVPQGKDAPKSGDAIVFDASGNFIRKYSLSLHGKDYGKLARQFADKIGGTVREA